MAKIVLGKRPQNFKHLVTVALPEGGNGAIEMTFTYRTRTQFGEFLDGILADAKVQAASAQADDVTISLAEALAKTCDQNADYIMRIAEGWNLDAEWNRANVEQLCDELPGVAMAIINTYRTAIAEGRLGN